MKKTITEYRDLREFICDWYSLEEIERMAEDWQSWALDGNHPGLRPIWEVMGDEIEERFEPYRGCEDQESLFSVWVQKLGIVIQDLCEKIAYEREEEKNENI